MFIVCELLHSLHSNSVDPPCGLSRTKNSEEKKLEEVQCGFSNLFELTNIDLRSLEMLSEKQRHVNSSLHACRMSGFFTMK
mmetsp:Transcript_20198/g.26489  ORF Transcript_20198/g.26489 Transcript_20198/m.26489 type:complete len:81 (+) Transcript_20198:309-551(+)